MPSAFIRTDFVDTLIETENGIIDELMRSLSKGNSAAYQQDERAAIEQLTTIISSITDDLGVLASETTTRQDRVLSSTQDARHVRMRLMDLIDKKLADLNPSPTTATVDPAVLESLLMKFFQQSNLAVSPANGTPIVTTLTSSSSKKNPVHDTRVATINAMVDSDGSDSEGSERAVSATMSKRSVNQGDNVQLILSNDALTSAQKDEILESNNADLRMMNAILDMEAKLKEDALSALAKGKIFSTNATEEDAETELDLEAVRRFLTCKYTVDMRCMFLEMRVKYELLYLEKDASRLSSELSHWKETATHKPHYVDYELELNLLIAHFEAKVDLMPAVDVLLEDVDTKYDVVTERGVLKDALPGRVAVMREDLVQLLSLMSKVNEHKLELIRHTNGHNSDPSSDHQSLLESQIQQLTEIHLKAQSEYEKLFTDTEAQLLHLIDASSSQSSSDIDISSEKILTNLQLAYNVERDMLICYTKSQLLGCHELNELTRIVKGSASVRTKADLSSSFTESLVAFQRESEEKLSSIATTYDAKYKHDADSLVSITDERKVFKAVSACILCKFDLSRQLCSLELSFYECKRKNEGDLAKVLTDSHGSTLASVKLKVSYVESKLRGDCYYYQGAGASLLDQVASVIDTSVYGEYAGASSTLAIAGRECSWVASLQLNLAYEKASLTERVKLHKEALLAIQLHYHADTTDITECLVEFKSDLDAQLAKLDTLYLEKHVISQTLYTDFTQTQTQLYSDYTEKLKEYTATTSSKDTVQDDAYIKSRQSYLIDLATGSLRVSLDNTKSFQTSWYAEYVKIFTTDTVDFSVYMSTSAKLKDLSVEHTARRVKFDTVLNELKLKCMGIDDQLDAALALEKVTLMAKNKWENGLIDKVLLGQDGHSSDLILKRQQQELVAIEQRVQDEKDTLLSAAFSAKFTALDEATNENKALLAAIDSKGLHSKALSLNVLSELRRRKLQKLIASGMSESEALEMLNKLLPIEEGDREFDSDAETELQGIKFYTLLSVYEEDQLARIERSMLNLSEENSRFLDKKELYVDMVSFRVGLCYGLVNYGYEECVRTFRSLMDGKPEPGFAWFLDFVQSALDIIGNISPEIGDKSQAFESLFGLSVESIKHCLRDDLVQVKSKHEFDCDIKAHGVRKAYEQKEVRAKEALVERNTARKAIRYDEMVLYKEVEADAASQAKREYDDQLQSELDELVKVLAEEASAVQALYDDKIAEGTAKQAQDYSQLALLEENEVKSLLKAFSDSNDITAASITLLNGEPVSEAANYDAALGDLRRRHEEELRRLQCSLQQKHLDSSQRMKEKLALRRKKHAEELAKQGFSPEEIQSQLLEEDKDAEAELLQLQAALEAEEAVALEKLRRDQATEIDGLLTIKAQVLLREKEDAEAEKQEAKASLEMIRQQHDHDIGALEADLQANKQTKEKNLKKRMKAKRDATRRKMLHEGASETDVVAVEEALALEEQEALADIESAYLKEVEAAKAKVDEQAAMEEQLSLHALEEAQHKAALIEAKAKALEAIKDESDYDAALLALKQRHDDELKRMHASLEQKKIDGKQQLRAKLAAKRKKHLEDLASKGLDRNEVEDNLAQFDMVADAELADAEAALEMEVSTAAQKIQQEQAAEIEGLMAEKLASLSKDQEVANAAKLEARLLLEKIRKEHEDDIRILEADLASKRLSKGRSLKERMAAKREAAKRKLLSEGATEAHISSSDDALAAEEQAALAELEHSIATEIEATKAAMLHKQQLDEEQYQLALEEAQRRSAEIEARTKALSALKDERGYEAALVAMKKRHDDELQRLRDSLDRVRLQKLQELERDLLERRRTYVDELAEQGLHQNEIEAKLSDTFDPRADEERTKLKGDREVAETLSTQKMLQEHAQEIEGLLAMKARMLSKEKDEADAMKKDAMLSLEKIRKKHDADIGALEAELEAKRVSKEKNLKDRMKAKRDAARRKNEIDGIQKAQSAADELKMAMEEQEAAAALELAHTKEVEATKARMLAKQQRDEEEYKRTLAEAQHRSALIEAKEKSLETMKAVKEKLHKEAAAKEVSRIRESYEVEIKRLQGDKEAARSKTLDKLAQRRQTKRQSKMRATQLQSQKSQQSQDHEGQSNSVYASAKSASASERSVKDIVKEVYDRYADSGLTLRERENKCLNEVLGGRMVGESSMNEATNLILSERHTTEMSELVSTQFTQRITTLKRSVEHLIDLKLKERIQLIERLTTEGADSSYIKQQINELDDTYNTKQKQIEKNVISNLEIDHNTQQQTLRQTQLNDITLILTQYNINTNTDRYTTAHNLNEANELAAIDTFNKQIHEHKQQRMTELQQQREMTEAQLKREHEAALESMMQQLALEKQQADQEFENKKQEYIKQKDILSKQYNNINKIELADLEKNRILAQFEKEKKQAQENLELERLTQKANLQHRLSRRKQ